MLLRLTAVMTVVIPTPLSATFQSAPAPQEMLGVPSSVARLCGAAIAELDARAVKLNSVVVTYAVSTYGPREGEEAQLAVPADAESPDRLQLCKVATVSRWGAASRVSEQTIWSRDAAEVGGIEEYTSDGTQYLTRFSNVRGGDSTLMLDMNDSVHRVGPQMDAYGWRVLGEVAPLNYQFFLNAAQNSTDLQVSHGDPQMTRLCWRWLPEAPQSEFCAALDRLSGALKSMEVNTYATDARLPNSSLMRRRAVEFQDYNLGTDLVRGARVVEQLGSAGEEYPPTWAVVIITPVSIQSIPCTPEALYEVPLRNEVVQDTRFDIAYRPHDRMLNIDGRLIHLEVVPEQDAGWELDRWVKPLPVWTEPPSPSTPAQSRGAHADARVFDAGKVLVGESPARISHDFVIHNDSGRELTVKQLVKSCGCIECEMSSHTIAPDGEAKLSIAMIVPSSGPREQTVTVIFDRGDGEDHLERFELRAHGCVPGTLRVISRGFSEHNGTWSADIRAYWVEADPELLSSETPPLVLAGDGATLHFDGWSVIEPAAHNGELRPRRLFGRGKITLADSESKEVRLRVAPSRVASLAVTKVNGQ